LAKPIDTDKLEQAIMAHLDDEIIEKPRETEESQELEEIPEEKRFLYDIEELNVEDGINASGGVNMYMGSLQLFYDTVEENSEVLENAFEKKDWQLYTIKAHALKTSARIVGANELSELCKKLEEAGKKNDISFIEENGPKAILDYKKLWEKLSPLGKKEEDHTEKPPLEEGELEEIYEALSGAVEQMDYDTVELLLKRAEEYALPIKDAEKMENLRKALHQFDWDAMEEIMT
ncbi:MAG: Hpt domain-containing protein, partial [Lachnospiraceae bacterium]|nr:Hpt domain-containing protein [Lachnospiraceae bacterium]